MKKTPWFPATVKPVREGWYEVKGCAHYMDCAGMHWWGCGAWWYGGQVVKALPWRGITK